MKKAFPLLAVALALFLASLWLCSRHLDFPYYYHPDEPGKTAQVIEDTRNFHHPLLLVNTVAAVVGVLDVPLRPQPVAVAGRWVSVAFSALAVVLLALFAAIRRGLGAALGAGLFLGLHPDVLQLAHYFKEDPALLFGIALTFLALLLAARPGGRWMALGPGAAAALAFSAKYIGIVVLPVALVFAWRKDRWRGMALCLAGFLLVAGLVNFEMFTHWSDATASLERETALIANGAYEVKRSIPHADYFRHYRQRLALPFGLFYLWGLVVWWQSRRREEGPGLERAVETAMIFFPLALTILMSFAAKSGGRYFHPCLLGLCYTAGLGLQDLAGRCWSAPWVSSPAGRGRRVLAAAVVAIALAGSGWQAYQADQSFTSDARLTLGNFIREKLPASAVVMQGRRVELPDPRGEHALDAHDFQPLPQTLLDVKSIADAGSVAGLQAQGVTHVAIDRREYEMYLDEGAKPKSDQAAIFRQRREFYRELFARSKVLLDIPGGNTSTHNPALTLLELPPRG